MTIIDGGNAYSTFPDENGVPSGWNANRDKMYFGNKERMTWVRAPDAGYDGSKIGWDGNVTQFLNGGAYTMRSSTAHKKYALSWQMMSRDEIRQITDYADGVYGDGAIYFLDPMAMDKNLLPQHWALPRLALKDAPILTGQSRDTVLEYPVEYTNTLGYPSKGIYYSYDAATWTAPLASLWCPIPPGYTAWFGMHGQVNTPTLVQVTTSDGAKTNIPTLANTNPNRFSNSFSGDSYSGITIGFTGTGSVILSGMMLQILPTGVAPEDGGFISGQGNSGVRFSGQPALTQNSRALDKASLVTEFIEDEAWR